MCYYRRINKHETEMDTSKKQQLLVISLEEALASWKWLHETPDFYYVRQGFNDFTDELLELYHDKLLVNGFYTVIKPVEILKVGTEKYILDGNSRLYALSKLKDKYPEIPINPIRYYYASDMSPLEVLRHQKISNDDIRQHRPSQNMLMISTHLDKGYSGKELADALGVKPMVISSAKRFMSLSDSLRAMVDNDEISLESMLKISQASDTYGISVEDAISKVRLHSGKERISLSNIKSWRDSFKSNITDTNVDIDVDTDTDTDTATQTYKKHIDIELPELSQKPKVSTDISLIHVDVAGDVTKLSRLFYATANQVNKMKLSPEKVNEMADILNNLLSQIPDLEPNFIDSVNKI